MSTWQSNYKAMTAEQLSAEYQRLLSIPGSKIKYDFADKLNFLKTEFKIKLGQK